LRPDLWVGERKAERQGNKRKTSYRYKNGTKEAFGKKRRGILKIQGITAQKQDTSKLNIKQGGGESQKREGGNNHARRKRQGGGGGGDSSRKGVVEILSGTIGQKFDPRKKKIEYKQKGKNIG